MNTLLKRLIFAARQIIIVLALVGVSYSGTAQAQTAEGTIGWFSPGVGGPFPSAYEACKAQWQYYNARPNSRFIGAKTRENNWTIQDCEWTRYQYLCPQETGGGINGCGTVIPNSANLVCASGYTATIGGLCRANPAVEQKQCECDEDGRINPGIGNPILLSTGAKVLNAEDYASSDGRFAISRSYRSFQVGRPIDGNNLPRALPRGLAGGWNFDFSYEIQLGTFSGTPATPAAKVAVLAPDGTGFGFVLQPDGQWLPDPALAAANKPAGLKLEFIGTLPAQLADLKLASNSWKLTDEDDTVWTLKTFNSQKIGNLDLFNTGWPIKRVERDGYTADYTYSADSSLASITDSFGRTATFNWHQFYVTTLVPAPAGSSAFPLAVASIALPDGTSLRYSYDPPPANSAPSTTEIQRLTKVERLSSGGAALDSVSYLYEDSRFPSHVTGIIDHRAIRVKTYAYDAQGRAVLTQGVDGRDIHTVEFGQNGSALTRRVTNGLGKAASYTFTAFNAGLADYRLTQVAGEASAATSASTSAVTYGGDTFIASAADAEGRLSTTTRDARGRPLSIVEGSGTSSQRMTTITWHPTLNVPVSIARPGLTETRSYNAVGQLSTLTLTDTTSQTVPYATAGQTRSYGYAWTAAGRLLSINGPLAPDTQNNDDITSFSYDPQGNLLSTTNAMGHVTSFAAHDANGRPGTMTDPNGVVTAFTYDGLGRVLSVTVRHPGDPGQNAVTTIGYDAIGQVTGITLPSTETLLMDYDSSGRVTSIRAANGERRDYGYDAIGNVTSETVKRSDGSTAQRITRAFDELGRLLSENTGLSRSARWAYDKVGNVVSATSPAGHGTTAAFDALDRLVSTVAPDAGSTTLAYDPQDNLVAHTDPVAVTTQFTRNGFGDVIQEVSPDRGTSSYWYDAAGDLVQASDGRGQVMVYTRDRLGRLTAKLPQGRPASEAVFYSWDTGGVAPTFGIGRLGRVDDGTGITQFGYDHRGNLVVRQQGLGVSGAVQLAYRYDLADRITQISYPSGRQVDYGYDSKGRVNLVRTRASAAQPVWTVVASGHGYEPFGAVKAMSLGNGLALAVDRGADGRLAARRLTRVADGAELSHLRYAYDADGQIGAIANVLNPAGSVLYGYDAVGRLVLMAQGGSAGSAGDAQSYGYTPGTNRLAAVTAAGSLRTIGYDGRGNTAGEARAAGGASLITQYDGHGRLTQYSRSDAAALGFAYNGLDERVAMARGSDLRRFVYAPDGRVLGEYGAGADDVKAEFIWALPAAANDNSFAGSFGGSFAGSFAGSFGGDDGLGGHAPLAVATPDAGGLLQLNWVHGNHLGVPLLVTDASGAPATTPDDYLAPGFPGQSRVLPDLYYNRHRDYDPSTGRYIQADPIGLAGGSNPFLYAGANPVSGIDPLGLQYRAPVRLPPRVPSGRRGGTLEEETRRASPPNTGGQVAPRYRPGETFIGPPGSGPTQQQIADARKVCLPYGETPWTRYGRQAHINYRTALGGEYEHNYSLPSRRRPDAVDLDNRVVRELKPANPRGIRTGTRQLERYRQELEAMTGEPWTAYLDLYRPPNR